MAETLVEKNLAKERLEKYLATHKVKIAHTAEELYAQIIGNENGILANEARFPEYREELARADEIEIPVQINGKLRSRVLAAPETANDELEKMALADARVREYTTGKEIVKVIVVPKRLVNIVIKG